MANKFKLNTIKGRRDSMKHLHTRAFNGTIVHPLDLSAFDGDATSKRPCRDTIMEKMTTFSSYTKNGGKSNVVCGGVSGVIRQGEWFAVPLKKEPKVFGNNKNNFAYSEDHENSGISLPVTSQNSNLHTFTRGAILIDREGLAARNFRLSHDDHADIVGEKDKWYRFYENTALQSFSQEKVD